MRKGEKKGEKSMLENYTFKSEKNPESKILFLSQTEKTIYGHKYEAVFQIGDDVSCAGNFEFFSEKEIKDFAKLWLD